MAHTKKEKAKSKAKTGPERMKELKDWGKGNKLRRFAIAGGRARREQKERNRRARAKG